jgi:DHA1 family multidrug resistance protein-like MFS transporter
METIRDSAFGKLVRIFTRKRWLRYPEEIDPSLWTECLKPEPNVKDEEAATLADTEADSWGLYAVMSQASRASRRLSSIAETSGVDKATPLLIDWRGEHDSEVCTRTLAF